MFTRHKHEDTLANPTELNFRTGQQHMAMETTTRKKRINGRKWFRLPAYKQPQPQSCKHSSEAAHDYSALARGLRFELEKPMHCNTFNT